MGLASETSAFTITFGTCAGGASDADGSGAGSRISGGRWNPKGIPTIYLARPRETMVAELHHMADAAGIKYEALVRAGRTVHSIEVNGLEVLDLRAPQNLEAVGLTDADLTDDDWGACSSVGHAAWFLHFGGIIAKSARHDSGFVLAAFEDRIQDELVCISSERIR